MSTLTLPVKNKPAEGWGPQGRHGAVSLSFDNLGEAARLQRGINVPESERGRHATASFIPALLDIVGDIPCSYFMEAWNVDVYPEAILQWHRAGKEVAAHAWQHEHWVKLATPERVDLLQRCRAAFASLGIDAKGFRPPGGALPENALREFADAGYLYCSPLGEVGGASFVENIAVLPFAWRHVDAYMLSNELSAMRVSFGDPEQAISNAQWADILNEVIDFALDNAKHITVIVHPEMLIARPELADALRDFVTRLNAESGKLWIASCEQVAAWLKSNQRT